MNGLLQQQPTEQTPPQEEEYPLEEDEAYQKATKWVYEQLYKGEFGEKIAKIVRAMPEPNGALADVTYRLTEKADEITGSNIAEENLIPLGVFVLEEVLEVAEAAGKEIDEAGVSKIFKKIILTWLRESGVDTQQMEQAFSQVDDNEFAKLARSENNG